MRPALWLGLLAVSGTSLALSWLPAADEEAPVVPTTRAAKAARPAAAADPAVVAATQTQASPRAAPENTGVAAAPPLAGRAPWPAMPSGARAAWLPPPPPPPPPAPPPVVPPPAPPPAFGYQWLGQIEEDGQVRVFLSNAQRTLAPVFGEVVDQRWRVDAIAAGRLQLTWLATGATVYVAGR